ncbi:hypothetical protein AAFC00_005552 [Neodothiora populina]|uniref:Mitochondrial glycine transporter n=1 Tax=Neodothiora populina TaxID=2781224 RepID=A0ABR3PLA3_9PEZI
MSDGGQKRKSSPSFHFLAGLSSGVTTAFLLQPADLLKTRVQQSRGSSLTIALRNILNGPSPLRQLWRGTTPSVIRTGAGSALYFGMLNQMRQHASAINTIAAGDGVRTESMDQNSSGNSSSRLPKLSNTANLATGALARASAGFIMSPVTVLKVRYESSYYNYTSLASAARDIAKTEGFRGFFAGFGATAVRDAPYAGLYVLFYEQSKAELSLFLSGSGSGLASSSSTDSAFRTPPSVTTSASINFASALIAAISATALTNPFDAIKTRIQLYPKRYGNMVSAAKMMLREEGLRSLFDGLGLRMGRKALSSALAWTVYEELIRRAESKLV